MLWIHGNRSWVTFEIGNEATERSLTVQRHYAVVEVREESIRKGFGSWFLPKLCSGLFGSCNSDFRLLAKFWNHIVNKPFFHIIGTYWFIKYKGSLRNINFLPIYTNWYRTFLKALIKFTYYNSCLRPSFPYKFLENHLKNHTN